MSDRIDVSRLRKEFSELEGAPISLQTFTIKVLLAILDTLVDIKHQFGTGRP